MNGSFESITQLPPVLTDEQVCAWAKCSDRTLRDSGLPFRKLGPTKLYALADIEAWVRRQKPVKVRDIPVHPDLRGV